MYAYLVDRHWSPDADYPSVAWDDPTSGAVADHGRTPRAVGQGSVEPNPRGALGALGAATGHTPGVEGEALRSELKLRACSPWGRTMPLASLYSTLNTGLLARTKPRQRVALVVLETLLVERRVEVPQELRDLVEVVLQQRRHPPPVRGVREEDVVAKLVGAGQAGTRSRSGSRRRCRTRRHRTLCAHTSQSRAHDRLARTRHLADVEPTLSRPAVRLAQDRLGERARIGPQLLPRPALR